MQNLLSGRLKSCLVSRAAPSYRPFMQTAWGLTLRRVPQLSRKCGAPMRLCGAISVARHGSTSTRPPPSPPSTLAKQRASSYNFAWGLMLTRDGPDCKGIPFIVS